MTSLVFLGTGAAANMVERQLSSIAFLNNNKSFLIDCGDGAGTMRQFVRAGGDIATLRDIFLTHRHADHMIGIVHVLFFLAMNDPDAVFSVHGPKQAVDIARSITEKTHDHFAKRQQSVAWHAIDSGDSVVVGDTKITAQRVVSPDKTDIDCFAYGVTTGSQKVVISGDMQPGKDFTKFSRGASLMIHECFGTSDNAAFIHQKGHSTAKDAGEVAETCNVKHLVLTHLLPTKKIGKGKAFVIDEAALAKEAKNYFNGKITVATDLLRIPLS